MKLAFSTLGCPDFDWPDMYLMAKDCGFQGIELRDSAMISLPTKSPSPTRI